MAKKPKVLPSAALPLKNKKHELFCQNCLSMTPTNAYAEVIAEKHSTRNTIRSCASRLRTRPLIDQRVNHLLKDTLKAIGLEKDMRYRMIERSLDHAIKENDHTHVIKYMELLEKMDGGKTCIDITTNDETINQPINNIPVVIDKDVIQSTIDKFNDDF